MVFSLTSAERPTLSNCSNESLYYVPSDLGAQTSYLRGGFLGRSVAEGVGVQRLIVGQEASSDVPLMTPSHCVAVDEYSCCMCFWHTRMLATNVQRLTPCSLSRTATSGTRDSSGHPAAVLTNAQLLTQSVIVDPTGSTTPAGLRYKAFALLRPRGWFPRPTSRVRSV